jgi:hypothetical protein
MNSKIIVSLGIAGLVLTAGSAHAELAYGITQQQRLIRFDTSAPTVLLSGLAISGLANNETVLGIDVRPNDGMLYALGSQNNLYRLNPANGAASLVGALSIALDGAHFGMDFNPTGPVALRIMSNTNRNYRMPTPGSNGNVIQDTNLAYVAGDVAFGVNPNVTHIAYTNSFFGATTTTLYGIDAGRDTLIRVGSPNAGTLNTVGVLGMGMNANINVIGGFDISGVTGNAYAATQNVGFFRSTLWSINLATGQATDMGEIAGGETLTAFTIVPAPTSAGALALAGIAGLRRRR